MATIAIPLRNHKSNPFPFLLFLMGLAFLIFLASTHAVIRHGQGAIDAQRCFQGGGVIQREIMLDPTTGWLMRFCRQWFTDKNGKSYSRWFVSIDKPSGSNVTAFPRSGAKCLGEVLKYAIDTGYKLAANGIELPPEILPCTP